MINAPVRKKKLIQVEGVEKGRGRPKITLVEVVKKNMLVWQTWLRYLEHDAGFFDVAWLFGISGIDLLLKIWRAPWIN